MFRDLGLGRGTDGTRGLLGTALNAKSSGDLAVGRMGCGVVVRERVIVAVKIPAP